MKAKYVYPIAIGLLIIGTFTCCALFNEDGIDVNALNAELKAVHADIGDLLPLAENDDNIYPILYGVYKISGKVQAALEKYIQNGGATINDVKDAVDLALQVTDQFLSDLPETDAVNKIKIGVVAFRMILRRVETYVLSADSNA